MTKAKFGEVSSCVGLHRFADVCSLVAVRPQFVIVSR